MSSSAGRRPARRSSIARAEAEAVAELKARAAGGRPRPQRRAAPSAPAAGAGRRPRTGEASGPTASPATGADVPDGIEGVDAGTRSSASSTAALAALVSRVPLAEFGEEPLRRNLNDFAWLERVARAHEAVLEAALAHATVVPLRLCTIFADEAGARRMLDERRAALDARRSRRSTGAQEWSVKLLVDRERARGRGRGAPSREPSATRPGQRRRLPAAAPRGARGSREAADRLAAELAEDVHARLQERASRRRRAPAPEPRALGPRGRHAAQRRLPRRARRQVDGLRELVAELEERHRELGARLELSGPFPPYNFVPAPGSDAGSRPSRSATSRSSTSSTGCSAAAS